MERYKKTKLASILGIIGNLFLLIIKGIVGFMTNSQAMIADAFNSAGDIFSSIMTFIGNQIASRPSDDTHNLGHGKAEYIFSMLISVSMVIVSIKLLINSISSLVYGSSYSFSWLLVIVCIITIITKFLLFLYTNHLSKQDNNLLIEANSKDHRNDCILTTFTLIASLLSLLNINWFDGVVGIGISIWILLTGIKIFIDSYDVLMDKALSEVNKKDILDTVYCHKEVKDVRHFNSTPVGYKYQISFTIYVNGRLSTFKSHDIANKIEKEITSKFDYVYVTIIHVNPI